MSKEEKRDLAVTPPDKTDELFRFAETLEEKKFVSENCKLCNSKNRDGAESLKDRGSSNMRVHRWLTEEKGEDISHVAVNNHFNNHWGVVNENTQIKELAGKLSKWDELNKTDEVLYRRYINAFDREIMALLAVNATVDLSERRKNNDTIVKLQGSIDTMKERLHKIHAEKRPVEVVIMSLHRIIQFKLDACDNPEVHKVLQDVISQLSQEVGEIAIDGSSELENG